MVSAVTPSGIGLEISGFSVGFAFLSKYFIGRFDPFHSIFSTFSKISAALPTSTILAFSSVKYLFAILCTSSTVTALILAI